MACRGGVLNVDCKVTFSMVTRAKLQKTYYFLVNFFIFVSVLESLSIVCNFLSSSHIVLY